MSKKVLEVKNLNKHFVSSYGINRAINNVSFALEKGEIMGLIGQSGSGKTTIGKALMRTLPETRGILSLDGKIYPNISKSNKKSLPYKKKVQMIYQNPMDSLNGLRNIYSTLEEALITHKIIDGSFKSLVASQKEVTELFKSNFELNASKLELWYFEEKAKLIKTHNLKYTKAIEEGSLKNYIFFEEEKLNKDIINLLTKLEDDYTEFYNKEFIAFVNKQSDSKEGKALIEAKNNLDAIKSAKDTVSNYSNNMKTYEKNVVAKTKEIEKDSKIAMKSLIKTQKSMAKSYKEISATQIDLFMSFTYKKEELISKRVKVIYKAIFKQMAKKALTAEKLHAFTENVDALFNDLRKSINKEFTNDLLVSEYKETFKSVKETIQNVEFDFSKYLTDKIVYANLAKKDLKPVLDKINKNLETAKKVKFTDELIGKLESKLKSATLAITEANKVKKAKNDEVIKERFFRRDILEKEIKELSKLLEANSKEAMKIFKTDMKKSIDEKKSTLKDMDSRGKRKQLSIKISGTKKSVDTLIKNYKVKNSAYEIEKGVITKNIKKIRMISGLERQPFIFKNKSYKEVIVTRRIYSILKQVGLKPEHAYRYPHEFSGGQLQRILIARALLVEPEVIIADEPIASLDISIQAQVINLLLDLVKQRNISMIFIGHDLSTIEYLCDSLLVLHLGRVVEKGVTKEIFKKPVHPYTQVLFKAIPKISEANKPFELFSDVNGYIREWKQSDEPSFHKVNENHLVYANEIQWKAWNGKKKRK